MVELAKSYYLDAMSQSEIAAHYKISRPTVANILRKCREKGIVEIRINDRSPFTSETGQLLLDKFGLKTVCVIPPEIDYPLTLYKTCLELAGFLAALFTNRIRIGITWGTSLFHTIRQLPKLGLVDCEAVQLVGGLGATDLYYDGVELARMLAEKINARYYPVLSPLLVQTQELRNALLKEPRIHETLEKAESLDLALVGLSSDQPESSALVKAGFLSIEEARQIYDEGSCGHLCGYHYNEEGCFMDSPINNRVIGITPEVFLQIKRRIGIACGEQKARAIHAALKGNFLTDLFTDELTALKIINFDRQ